MPLAVNMLRNTSKVSPDTRGDIFQINFNEYDEKTWYKCCHGYIASIWDAFTCWLSKRVLKRRFLESALSKFFTVCNFSNTLAMMITVCFKMFKIWCRFKKWNKKLRKSFLFLDSCIWIGTGRFTQCWTKYFPSPVNVLKLSPKISPNTRRDTFQINFPENDEKYDKISLVEIWQLLGTLSHVDFQCVLWNSAL